MRRNFLCFDDNGYVRSILHINKLESSCEATIYVAANATKSVQHAKWIILKAENEEENSIIENSLFIKPFFKLVELRYYPNITLFPFALYYDTLEEVFGCKRFQELNYTIKEYNSKKYKNGLPDVEEMSPKNLKLPL